MKIIKQFRNDVRQSLDIEELTRMLFENVRATCSDLGTFNGAIFMPSGYAQEWGCYATLTSDLIPPGDQAKMLFDELSDMADYFAGFPGTIYEYKDLDTLEQIYGDDLPFFLEGYHVVIYAAETEDETLVCGVFLQGERPFTSNEKQSLGYLLDAYCEQVGKTARICNRLSGMFEEESWDDDEMTY
jgi:hypothetical protein